MVDAANDAGGNDNITAVLVENNNWPKQKPEPVPVERKKDTITFPVATNETAPVHNISPAKKMAVAALHF